jgi:hypothetical protein
VKAVWGRVDAAAESERKPPVSRGRRDGNVLYKVKIDTSGLCYLDRFFCCARGISAWFKFFHSLSVTSIFAGMHETLNIDKKIINYTV